MQLKKLMQSDDKRAVSPVIGVILMVAITVILAAVIGTFVLGLGDQVQQTAPNTQMSFDYTQNAAASDELDITHEGGDRLPGDRTFVVIAGSSATQNTINDRYQWSGAMGGTADVSAGETVTIDDATPEDNTMDDDVDLSGATVRIVWESQDGGSTSTVARWSGPDA